MTPWQAPNSKNLRNITIKGGGKVVFSSSEVLRQNCFVLKPIFCRMTSGNSVSIHSCRKTIALICPSPFLSRRNFAAPLRRCGSSPGVGDKPGLLGKKSGLILDHESDCIVKMTPTIRSHWHVRIVPAFGDRLRGRFGQAWGMISKGLPFRVRKIRKPRRSNVTI
jgi:hypothetical protein